MSEFDDLKRLVNNIGKDGISTQRTLLHMRANLMALNDVIADLKSKGIESDKQAALDHIRKLAAKHHADILADIETVNPVLASILDQRDDLEIDEGI